MLALVASIDPSQQDHAGAETGIGAGSGVLGSAPGLPPVCPYLAGGDGTWRSVEPARSHTCAAVEPPAILAVAKQRQLCLGAGHPGCATFRAARQLLAPSAPGAFEAGLWPRSSTRVVTLDPVRTGLAGGLTTPQARAGGQVLLVGLIVVAFSVLLVARGTPSPTPASTGSSPLPTVVAGAGSSDSPPAAATLAPAAGAATPGVSPGIAASPSGGVDSVVEKTYKVKRGDTLGGIARKFGVTVKALRKANGLTTGDVIKRGQVLVIPEPVVSPSP